MTSYVVQLRGGLLPGMIPPSGPTLTFRGSSSTSAAGPSYTQAAASLGPADATRIVVVAIQFSGGSSRSIASVTVGGVTATLRVESPVSADIYGAVIYTAPVPSGTTGDIVVTASGGDFNGTAIGWWTVTGAANSAPTDTQTANATNPLSVSINVPAGGFVVASGIILTGSGGTATWGGTGIDSAYEEDPTMVNGWPGNDVGASRAGLSANGSYSVTLTESVGPLRSALAVMSWT